MSVSQKETRERALRPSHLLDPCPLGQKRGTLIQKVCIQKHQCGHCAFDQWLDLLEEQMGDGGRPRFIPFPGTMPVADEKKVLPERENICRRDCIGMEKGIQPWITSQ